MGVAASLRSLEIDVAAFDREAVGDQLLDQGAIA